MQMGALEKGGKVVAVSMPLALTLITLVVLAVLIVGARSQVSERCMDAEMREQVRAVVISGIDLAFKEHTKRLFEIWMKDVSEQPKRAQAGMNNAIDAYVRARTAALKWSPPLCPG
jgi:hypothetical protein